MTAGEDIGAVRRDWAPLLLLAALLLSLGVLACVAALLGLLILLGVIPLLLGDIDGPATIFDRAAFGGLVALFGGVLVLMGGLVAAYVMFMKARTSRSTPAQVEEAASRPRRATPTRLLGVFMAFAVAAILASAVLWIGGAAEVILHDIEPDGPGCVWYSDSYELFADHGKEAGQWVGGGMLWRPGRVCEFGGFAQKRLTIFDVGSAAAAGLSFALASVLLSIRWAGR